jgi:hypothetical protein
MVAASNGSSGSSKSTARARIAARNQSIPGGDEPLAGGDPNRSGQPLDERQLVDQWLPDDFTLPHQHH